MGTFLSRRNFIQSAFASSLLLPNYANARLHGSFPQCPPPALSIGFTKLLHYSYFGSLNNVDVANSGAAGKDWYPRFAWPRVANAGVSSPQRDSWISFTDQNTTAYSIAPNGGLISNFNGGDSGINISSACANALSPFYVGNVFGPSFYVESVITGYVGAGFGSLACFGFPIEFFTQGAADFVELDFIESTGSNQYHQGMIPWQMGTNPAGNNPGDGPFQINLPWNYPDPIHTGCLKVDSTLNGGTGLVDCFTNNVSVGGPFPFAMTGNYAASDQHHYVIMTNQPGSNSPTGVKSIIIWGPP